MQHQRDTNSRERQCTSCSTWSNRPDNADRYSPCFLLCNTSLPQDARHALYLPCWDRQCTRAMRLNACNGGTLDHQVVNSPVPNTRSCDRETKFALEYWSSRIAAQDDQ